ncbi:MAG: hypothetical protein DRP75_00235 [Candidatus Omnitrophota bacterium]|nr:MAG: hypothetical protein DRP75_00235 [Candidatus Omnitrophota bacterium]
MEERLVEKFKRVKLLLLDVDGVLTEGRIMFLGNIEEIKCFDVYDGLGVVLLKRAGIKTIIITAKKSSAVRKRAKEMEIEEVYQGVQNKLKVYQKILKKHKVLPEEIGFIGDEIIDLPVLEKVGLSIAVPNAVEEVKQKVDYITHKEGGRGAVREVCEIILKTQGKWEGAIKRFLNLENSH